ncbi:MAG TPA: hypothetical protein VKG78_00435, partial [Opitutaceae bacterium]|nr:hypothetical protein [Opitutaceae bacterium]
IGIPVNADDYAGQYLPQALNVTRNGLEALFIQARAAKPGAGYPWMAWIYTSFLGILWLNLVCSGRSPVDFSRGRAGALWLGMVPFFIWGPWQPVATLAAMAVLAGIFGWGLGLRDAVLWLALPVVAALSLHGWGRLLAEMRPWMNTLSHRQIAEFWAAAALAGGVVSTRTVRPWITGILMGGVGLLFFPAEDPYGFAASMVPLISCWYLFYAVSTIRCGAEGERDVKPAMRRLAMLGLAGAALFLFLQAYAFTDSQGGYFTGWRSVIPGLGAENTPVVLAIATFAKVLVFFPRRPSVPEAVCGAGLIVMLAFFETRAWVPPRWQWVEILSALLAIWLVGLRLSRPEAPLFGLAFWFLLFVCVIVPNRPNYLDTSCMIGAIVVCARVMKAFPQPEHAVFDAVILGLFGLFITGWACSSWSVSHIEWHAAFSWLTEPVIERYVYLFAAWVALKCLVPWVIIVLILKRELHGLVAFPANALLVVFSAKLLGAVMVNSGLGGADTLNRSYLEGASVTAVLAILSLGIVLMPDCWPKPAGGSVGIGRCFSRSLGAAFLLWRGSSAPGGESIGRLPGTPGAAPMRPCSKSIFYSFGL